jgi:hydroxymethylpyrimidine/phosphomethylpyrimidine kinase
MLYSCEIIDVVCDTLAACLKRTPQAPPIVVDPVMVATSGDPLLQGEAVALYRERLFPLAALITPNLDEVRTLLGRTVASLEEMHTAGQELAASYGRPFLIKGGHLKLDPAIDLLCMPDEGVQEYSAPFVKGISTHGTGCTYAAAITAGLAKGLSLTEAVGEAKQFLANAVAHYLRWTRDGRTTDALHHFAPRK